MGEFKCERRKNKIGNVFLYSSINTKKKKLFFFSTDSTAGAVCLLFRMGNFDGFCTELFFFFFSSRFCPYGVIWKNIFYEI